MTETESLILHNLLNGVPAAEVARAVGEDEKAVMAAFQEAMRRVAEYILVHCVAFFPCIALSEARRNRVQIFEILGAIERWDAFEREIVESILKGRNILKEGVPREVATQLLDRTLNALPHYLRETDIRPYSADRAAFVRDNRKRVIEAVEKFVSFRNPLLYKHIEHQTVGQV